MSTQALIEAARFVVKALEQAEAADVAQEYSPPMDDEGILVRAGYLRALKKALEATE